MNLIFAIFGVTALLVFSASAVEKKSNAHAPVLLSNTAALSSAVSGSAVDLVLSDEDPLGPSAVGLFDIQEVDPPSASGATVGVEDVSTARDNAGEGPPNLRGAGLRTSVGLTCIHRGGACNLQTTCCSTGGQLNYCHFGTCCKFWFYRIEC